MKKDRAITLVALVITIIVLLILAGVTISLTLGERGIFTTAQRSVQNHKNAQEIELEELAKFENVMNSTIKDLNNNIKSEEINTPVNVGVTKVEVDIAKNKIKVGETTTVTANVLPENATNKNITWNSENDLIATVSTNGVVTAIGAGTTKIIATSESGGVIGDCDITIYPLYISFTKEFLNSGSKYEETKSSVNVLDFENGAVGLDIKGASETYGRVPYYTIRWYKNVDLSGVSSIDFDARKVAVHGSIFIGIDNVYIYSVAYPNLDTNWHSYSIPINYNGEHTISIGGGYYDPSGSLNSNTQYKNIKLMY